MANVLVLADVEVLKCDIKAGIENDGTNTTVVAYGKSEQTPPPRVTFTEVAAEFADMIGVGDLNLPSGVGDVELSLNQVYYKKVTANSVAVADAQATNISDYALSLNLYAEKLTEGWPVKVKNVSIKVWQTDNTHILDDMDITGLKQLLGQAV